MSNPAPGRDAIPPRLNNPGAGTEASGLGGAERQILAAITERLIPTDDHGSGAREANVVRYIDRALASEYATHRPVYEDGLPGIDALATAEHGSRFVDLAPEQQDALLTAIELGKDPSLSAFFELVLQHTREGMFGDPAWGGNSGQVGWDLLGYSGPRREWTELDQRVEVTGADHQTGREHAP